MRELLVEPGIDWNVEDFKYGSVYKHIDDLKLKAFKDEILREKRRLHKLMQYRWEVMGKTISKIGPGKCNSMVLIQFKGKLISFKYHFGKDVLNAQLLQEPIDDNSLLKAVVNACSNTKDDDNKEIYTYFSEFLVRLLSEFTNPPQSEISEKKLYDCLKLMWKKNLHDLVLKCIKELSKKIFFLDKDAKSTIEV